jgi:glycosyltransferase involved in cell wall biosynthesis
MVKQAIQSVFNQNLNDFEIIVVNDGSGDDTTTALEPFLQNPRFRYVQQENAGLSAARNHGIRVANGKYISFLDDDDLYCPNKLARQVAYLEMYPNAMLVHCWFSKFDTIGNDLGVRNTSWFRGEIYPSILTQWSILMATPCVMVRREIFQTVGFFDEDLDAAEDLDMWRRIARYYPFHVVPESLVLIRSQNVSMSSDKSKSELGFRKMLDKAFKEDVGLGRSLHRRAYGNMYAKLGQNLLGEGTDEQMNFVREYSLRAVSFRPLQMGNWLTWLASFLPRNFRLGLASWLRRVRYPTASD